MIRVKKLKWQIERFSKMESAASAVGTYFVWESHGTYFYMVAKDNGQTSFSIGTTIESAKAAAQADYEARILSAIEPEDAP